MRSLVELHRGEQPAPAGCPLHVAVTPVADVGIDLPELQRCGRVEAFQRDAETAWIFAVLRAAAEA